MDLEATLPRGVTARARQDATSGAAQTTSSKFTVSTAARACVNAALKRSIADAYLAYIGQVDQLPTDAYGERGQRSMRSACSSGQASRCSGWEASANNCVRNSYAAAMHCTALTACAQQCYWQACAQPTHITTPHTALQALRCMLWTVLICQGTIRQGGMTAT